MFGFNLALADFFFLGFFQRSQLNFRLHPARLCHLLLQMSQPLFERFQTVSKPDTPNSGRRNEDPLVAQLITGSLWPQRRIFQSQSHYRFLGLFRYTVSDIGNFATLFLQGF